MQADWVIGLWNGVVSLFGLVSFIFVYQMKIMHFGKRLTLLIII